MIEGIVNRIVGMMIEEQVIDESQKEDYRYYIHCFTSCLINFAKNRRIPHNTMAVDRYVIIIGLAFILSSAKTSDEVGEKRNIIICF